MSELNRRQKRFLKNHLEENMNATAAYFDAYDCKEESARRAASLLLTNVDILVEIEAFEIIEEKATRRSLRGKAERAAEVLGSALDSDDENVAIKAATQVLDRTGHKAIDQVEHGGGIGISVTKAIMNGSFYDKG